MIDAALGTSVTIPAMGDRSIEVKIPPGTQNGTMLRLRGRGMRSDEDPNRGNQLVTVNITIPTDLSESEKALLIRLKQSLGRMQGD